MVPHNQGLVPDANFIWNYLGDFWNIYSDKERWSTIWSSMIQITANELLSAYQVDYNKSIKDIQDLFQKKWINYNPKLDIDAEKCSFIVADDQAGLQAETSLINVPNQPTFSNIVTIPIAEGSFTKTTFGKNILKGRLLSVRNSVYTMLRSTGINTRSAFFGDRDNIRTGFNNLPWRFSSTLIHSSLNLEQEGVTKGDVMVVEVNKIGTNLKVNIKLQITAVDRSRVGFVFNIDNLIEGTAASGLSSEDQLLLASSLGIEGLIKTPNGTLVYEKDALVIKNTIESLAFKRAYYESELNLNSIIKIGPISISVKPLYIIRNTKIAVDDKIESVPGLQEYIKQPFLVKTGNSLGKLIGDKVYPLNREPYVLFENLDYILDNEKTIQSTCIITAASNIIRIPWGDLIDKNIQENDILFINGGLNAGKYVIRQVLDNERIIVTPIPQANETGRKCTITRQLKGKFIRFVKSIFNPKNPAPEKLWAEVTYIDNSKSIENNFGLLVKFTKEQKDTQGITAPYKSAVAGLMYAYSRGPTIYNLKLGAQVLLGLPFAYHRGVILEINSEYRLGEQLEPLFGRILIEERDKYDKPTGLIDIYLYPRGKQVKLLGKWVDQDPDFSGLGINPKTGKTFKEGDLVDAFTILSKGVEISDYLSDPTWYSTILGDPINSIQKYHKAYLRANIDLYGTADFDFVADYLRNTKPHYVFLVALALKSFVDDVIIEDYISFKPIYTFFEACGLSLPNAAKFDGYYITPEYMVYDGLIYTRYNYGEDLVTDKGSNTVTSAAGGFVTQRTLELHDTPYIRAGDLLVITNKVNMGKYLISAVNSDTSLTVTNTGTFESLIGQNFTIYRPVSNPIFIGNASVSVNFTDCLFSSGNGGPLSSGIAVNDVLVFNVNGACSKQYKVSSISANSATISPQVIEPSGTYPCIVYREGLLVKSLLFNETANPFSANTFANNPWITFNAVSVERLAALNLKDTIYLIGHPPYTALDFAPNVRAVYVTPTPTIDSSDIATKVWRTYLPNKPISSDIVDELITDPLYLEMRDLVGLYSTLPNSVVVGVVSGEDPTVLGIKPGDFVKITKNTHMDYTNDVGYGPGYFPIARVTPTEIHLTRQLSEPDDQCTIGYVRHIR